VAINTKDTKGTKDTKDMLAWVLKERFSESGLGLKERLCLKSQVVFRRASLPFVSLVSFVSNVSKW